MRRPLQSSGTVISRWYQAAVTAPQVFVLPARMGVKRLAVLLLVAGAPRPEAGHFEVAPSIRRHGVRPRPWPAASATGRSGRRARASGSSRAGPFPGPTPPSRREEGPFRALRPTPFPSPRSALRAPGALLRRPTVSAERAPPAGEPDSSFAGCSDSWRPRNGYRRRWDACRGYFTARRGKGTAECRPTR